MTPIERAARAIWDLNILLTQEECESAARAVLAAIREPSRAMLDIGMTKADDCLDSDWDSGPDGEGRYEYTTLRSDAPAQIWQAMIDAALAEQ